MKDREAFEEVERYARKFKQAAAQIDETDTAALDLLSVRDVMVR